MGAWCGVQVLWCGTHGLRGCSVKRSGCGGQCVAAVWGAVAALGAMAAVWGAVGATWGRGYVCLCGSVAAVWAQWLWCGAQWLWLGAVSAVWGAGAAVWGAVAIGRILPGTRVRLQGLQSSEECHLNGEVGVVEEDAANSERYIVSLKGQGNVKLALKENNLELTVRAEGLPRCTQPHIVCMISNKQGLRNSL
ncbi:hypothetical protein CYMTET_7241 [Cymbomonas tetramitiformis]|uniref:Uncharacterized protein n=1 Tax=Cymbomonas tetramitiformis TaxID=36881 RepID=A0AAE0GVN1_9CHLO|nr:hypothetical protein CYMTET_7241 [Cymbomonas tetramitiformis]